MYVKTLKDITDKKITKFNVNNGSWIGEIEKIDNETFRYYCKDNDGAIIHSHVYRYDDDITVDLYIEPLRYVTDKHYGGKYSYQYYTQADIEFCSIFVDKTRCNGVLRFTHEIDILFRKDNNKWKFASAWCCGVSESYWDENEEESFEISYPGLLSEVRKPLG